MVDSVIVVVSSVVFVGFEVHKDVLEMGGGRVV